jgi:dual specificity phosphatase 12
METVLHRKRTCSRSFPARLPIQLLPPRVVPGGAFVARCVGETCLEAVRIVMLKGLAFRTELANREHMLDHGQLGPPTPAVALSPASSRRPSTHDGALRRSSSSSSRRPSAGALGMSRPRLGSSSGLTRPSPLTPVEGSNGLSALTSTLSMSAVDDDDGKSIGQESDPPTSQAAQRQRRAPSFGTDLRSRLLAGLSTGSNLSMSALDSDDEESVGSTTAPSMTMSTPRTGSIPTADTVPSPLPTSETSETIKEDPNSAPTTGKSRPALALSTTAGSTGTFQHGAELAAQLHTNPKLAALRSPGGFSMTPMTPLHAATAPRAIDKSSISPPILMNPKCSGYFVEPVS